MLSTSRPLPAFKYCNIPHRYGSSHSSSFKCGVTLPRPPLVRSPLKFTVHRSVVNEMDAQSFESCTHGAAVSILPRDIRSNASATLSCDFRSLTAKRDSLAQALPTQSMKVAVALSHAHNDTDDMYVEPLTAHHLCVQIQPGMTPTWDPLGHRL
jgi:hypothetical protein